MAKRDSKATPEEIAREEKGAKSRFIQKLRAEPQVAIRGDLSFKETMGDYSTYLINGVPFTIYFNGKYQKFPRSIAKLLQKKLDAIAASNLRKDVTVEI
jgi:hypothetical protein